MKACLFGVHRTGQGVVDRFYPREGVLPRLVWNMTVDDLLVRLNNEGYLSIACADDIAILISGAFEVVLSSLVNEAFRILEKWCNESGLSVNPVKTGLIFFTNKRKFLALSLPTLFGVKLKLTHKVKYIEVILDSELNWKEQIEERTKKAIKVF